LDSARLGEDDQTACPRCGSTSGKKLDRERLEAIAHRFFVHGTLRRPKFGGYPGLQFNDLRYPEDSVVFPAWLVADARLIADILKVGIFEYGPRFWMFGEIEPLKALRRKRRPRISALRIRMVTSSLSGVARLRRGNRSQALPVRLGERLFGAAL
jgi:hypothetical protein